MEELPYIKHEIIPCERCGSAVECRANSFSRCQCSTVQLSIAEVEYIGEHYEGCLCANCLRIMQAEYQSKSLL